MPWAGVSKERFIALGGGDENLGYLRIFTGQLYLNLILRPHWKALLHMILRLAHRFDLRPTTGILK